MSTDALNQIRDAAIELAWRAKEVGVVVTIHTEPRQPPAMGNYYMSVDVRPARHAPAVDMEAIRAAARRIVAEKEHNEGSACTVPAEFIRSFTLTHNIVAPTDLDYPESEAALRSTEALRDMLDRARADLEVIRAALGVPIEPHQSLMERIVEAAEAKAAVRPDVEEVARLAHAYADAKLTRYGLLSPDPTSADPERAFVALYLAIKAIAVERDQFRGATKLVPAAWQVWCGLGNMQPYWPVFRTKEEADDTAKTIKTYTEVRPLWSHASAAPQPVGAKIVGGAA